MVGLKIAALLLLITFCQADSKCGKSNLRINYGKKYTYSSLEKDGERSCRFRIKAPIGYHIKVVFQSYKSDPCCSVFQIFDATQKPFRYRPSMALALPSALDNIQGTDVEQIFETYLLGVKHDITTSAGDQWVTFSYEAVVPADGDCGFTTFASSKSKVIRSPGFPKIKSQSGLDCNWKIKSKSGKAIALRFSGLRINKGGDYVLVYDGDKLLGEHSGKQDRSNPIEHIARSGLMKIRYVTATTLSKGFRASYKTIEANETSFDNSSSSSGVSLQCHQIAVVRRGQRIMSNIRTTMTCPAGQLCARMVMDGEMFGTEMWNENANCLPAAMCSESCSLMPPPPEVTVISCAMSCCSTNLCNGSPDVPIVAPSGGVSPVPPISTGGATECYDILSSRAGGITVLDRKSPTKCTIPDSSCVRIEAVAGAQGGIKAHVVYGACVPTIACNVMDCSALNSAMAGMTLESCDTSCCESDLCNGGQEEPVDIENDAKVGGDEDSEGAKCYDLLQVEAPGIEIPGGKKTKTTCDPGSECLKITALATHDLMPSIKVKTTYGSCIPSIACAYMNCDSLPTAMSNVTITSCDVSCCYDDYCNE